MAYLPEQVYGLNTTLLRQTGRLEYGLHPLPDHLRRREHPSGVELTKKDERYVQAALAEADGVLFLTLDGRDRVSLATTIERLINLLDDLEPDADLEPVNGWSETFGCGIVEAQATDDREGDDERDVDLAGAFDDREINGDETDYDGGESDAPLYIWGGGEDAPKPDMPGYV